MEHRKAERPADACCAGTPACCAPGAAGRKTWKSIAFALVMLGAVAVGAASLLKGGKSPDQAPSDPDGPAVSVAASWGEGLALYESLDEDLPNATFAFVVLSAPDSEAADATESAVASVVGRIVEQGGRANMYTVAAGTPTHAEAVAHFAVEDLPAIIAVRKGSTATLVRGDTTEDALYQVYLDACGPDCESCATCP